MKYIDANILIYAFTDTEDKGKKSREILEKESLVSSTLSLDEVVHKLNRKSLETALAAIEVLEHIPNLEFVAFLPEDFELFKTYLKRGLGPRDAIHALTAEKTECQLIYSEDRDFDRIEIPRKTPW